MQGIIVVFVCLLTGGLGAWAIQRYGFKLGIVDVPNERSSHDNVIPKGGGIGMLAAFVFCSLYLGVSKSFWISELFWPWSALLGTAWISGQGPGWWFSLVVGWCF